jgi:AcrR family transcriptional regulator
MKPAAPPHLNARKRPRQTRASATLEAIFEATIQVLVAEGPQRLTTTRVAQRAGVSVGTIYQYFPHKRALFYAINERYLDHLAATVERSCKAQHGGLIADMIEALIASYWSVKMERPEATRALYHSTVEFDNKALVKAFSQRMNALTTAMFTTASDTAFHDVDIVNLTLLATTFGAVRAIFERGLSFSEARAVREHLILMCIAYVKVVGLPRERAPRSHWVSS